MATEASLFVELNAALERENYTKAVEICNNIRSRNPDDQDAVRVKCIALIRLEKACSMRLILAIFDKALELATKYDFLAAERAYCLYRQKNDEDVLKLVETSEKNATLLHLQAQALYRQGAFDKSIAIYEELLASARPEDDTMELQANLVAAYASAGRSHELQQRDIPIDDSFEIAFNKSFIAIEPGNWAAARESLEESERLCREVLFVEGTSASEIENEVAVIRAQLAYVKQMQGDADGALSEYRNILKLKLSNQAVAAVASNNIVSIRKDRDLFDSLKRLKAIENETTMEKLNFQQQEAVLTNRALVLCLMNKTGECRESIVALKARFPASKALAEIAVMLALKDSESTDAISVLENDFSLGGRLGLAHVYLAQGRSAEAAAAIRSIKQIAYTPGTVATLVALYEAAGDSAAAQDVLREAVEYHKQHDFSSSHAMKIREGVCAHQVEKKEYESAAAAYMELLEGEHAVVMEPDLRLRSLASLAIALSYCDAKAAEVRCAMLPPVPESNLDPAELEQMVQRSNRLASKLADAGEKKNGRKRAAKNPERIARKRAKRREAHLQKLRERDDYNPTIGLVNPDPERWIPRKQRSYGKRGRRGRNRFVGAQGAGMSTSKDALKLDAAARAARKADEEEKKPAAVVVSSSSTVLRKSKKKKRR
ncbi:TPA: hypothetical protein N0F65_001492 [Lagenidium giganteum]|uniref:Signal recognition particle subunit SRP72 n=1 Tax=Lagenidium giganteum TaxID=4803 RepID=A0AAV2Z4F1_9STRA|nr:TPA: hypothetical protein N0F65_001492 [Lagenidium giganteum]